jgi:cbb3-type cytochrome oxidase cytochrome c subunit
VITWEVEYRGSKYKNKWHTRFFKDSSEVLPNEYIPGSAFVYWKNKDRAIRQAKKLAKKIYEAMNEDHETVRGTYP